MRSYVITSVFIIFLLSACNSGQKFPEPNSSGITGQTSVSIPDESDTATGQSQYITTGEITMELIQGDDTNDTLSGFRRVFPYNPYGQFGVTALVYAFAVSPDETRIAFIHMKPDGTFVLSVSLIDGTDEKELGPVDFTNAVTWLDNDTIAYFLSNEGTDNLVEHVVDLATMNDHIVPYSSPPVHELKYFYRMDFSVKIALNKKTDNSILPTGITAQLTGNEANTVFVVSPSGKWAVYEVSNRVGTVDYFAVEVEGKSHKQFASDTFLGLYDLPEWSFPGTSLQWKDDNTFLFETITPKISPDPNFVIHAVSTFQVNVDTEDITLIGQREEQLQAPRD